MNMYSPDEIVKKMTEVNNLISSGLNKSDACDKCGVSYSKLWQLQRLGLDKDMEELRRHTAEQWIKTLTANKKSLRKTSRKYSGRDAVRILKGYFVLREGGFTSSNACKLTCCSVGTVKRFKRLYDEYGYEGLAAVVDDKNHFEKEHNDKNRVKFKGKKSAIDAFLYRPASRVGLPSYD